MTQPFSRLRHSKEALRRVKTLRTRWRGKTYLEGRTEARTAVLGLERVVRWAAKRGWKVTFTPALALTDFQTNTINVPTQCGPQGRLATLLHELGHVILDRRPTYVDRFGKGRNSRRHGTAYRVTVIEEEIEAWNEGHRLAQRLRVKVDMRVWNGIRTASLMTYVRWAGEKELRVL